MMTMRLVGISSAMLLTAAACGGGGGGSSGTSGGSAGVVGTTNGPGGTSAGPGTTSGGSSQGSTTGGATTVGATSGGATAGAPTTGTTTGGTTGASLSAGAVCSANAQCQSGICGSNGSGNCCTAQCSVADATCGASGCGDTGACTYPSATNCGTDSCSNAQLTQSDCDGSGTCAPQTPVACTGNLACKDSSSCLTQCGADGDCVSGFYCKAGTCQAMQAVGPCASSSACTSGVCGVSGTGDCCTAACAATADPACDATACDATTGACVYAAGAVCSGTCSAGTLTAGVCDATGACGVPSTGACPGNLACNGVGTGCLTTCTQLSDCVSGFYCSGGACLAQLGAGGACQSNDACSDGICGATGTGHCCTATCSTSDPTCGATDCDGAGGCSFPPTATVCGTESCAAGIQTNTSSCDGAGTCLAPTTLPCTPFICGQSACLTACSGSSDCITGDFCDNDTENGACCSGLATGGTIAVDSMSGSDSTACCGFGGAGACATLTHAMSLIGAAEATGVTMVATVNGGGGDWGVATEPSYPVALGWGVELSAPGVYFLNPPALAPFGSPNTAIFDIKEANGDTTGYASMVGSATSPIAVGMDSANTTQTDAVAAIQVEGGNTLYIANASVNGSYGNLSNLATLMLEPTAAVVLGQDQAGVVTGTVTLGNALGNQATDGWQGLVTDTSAPVAAGGCSITDAALDGGSSVVIEGQEGGDIIVVDSNVALSSNPVLGLAPSAAGFNNCPFSPKTDAQLANGSAAIEFQGLGRLTLQNAVLQCIDETALHTTSDNNGAPAVSLSNTIIQNTGQAILAEAGVVTVTTSTIEFNTFGVEQAGTATVDLSGGGNTVVCSSNTETESQPTTTPGIDVYNDTVALLKADKVAWDTTKPDYFSCNGTFANCTCMIAACTDSAGADGMDAVEDSTALGGISVTQNTLSTITCQ